MKQSGRLSKGGNSFRVVENGQRTYYEVRYHERTKIMVDKVGSNIGRETKQTCIVRTVWDGKNRVGHLRQHGCSHVLVKKIT